MGAAVELAEDALAVEPGGQVATRVRVRNTGEVVDRFTFDRPFDLARVGFYNGAQTKPQDFLSEPRLRTIHLVYDTGETVNLTLKDQDGFQSYEVDAKRVKVITMLITAVYPSPLGGTDASLGEVEFFTKT